MLAYLILTGRNGEPVDPGLVHRFERDELTAVPFVPEGRLVWKNHDGSVVFLGWQAFTDLAGIRSHWAVDALGLTAFSGHCWPQETGWDHHSGSSWAEQLRAWLRDRDIDDAPARLFGQFGLISLNHDGAGLVAPDFLNADPVYLAEGNGYTAVSNRSALCAQAVAVDDRELGRSLTGAGWLICHGFMLDEETGYWDVQHLPFGSRVRIGPNGGATVSEPSRSPLVPGDALTYPEVLNQVDMHLRANLRMIAGLPISDLEFHLSGGKDSRLLLALILDEGLRDRFSYITYGPPDKADPIVARQLADRFTLDWTLRDQAKRQSEAEEREVRLHTGLVEGMVSGWDSAGPANYIPGGMVTGLAGEYLRFGRRGIEGTQVSDLPEFLTYLRSRTDLDPLRVLRPEATGYYAQILDTWATTHVERGEDLQRLGSFYLAETLVRGRFGPMRAFRGHTAFSPYVTATVVQACHRLPASERSRLRLQIDLLRRCDISLSKLPFADKSWDAAALQHLPDADDYLRIVPTHSASASAQNYRLANYAAYRPMLERYVLDRDNPIHELVRYDRLVDRIARGDDNPGRIRRLWGVLTAAIWMGGHELDAKISR